MAIQEGYKRYACDVTSCDEAVYALPDTDAADMYATRRRIDANGEERSYVLCPEHAQAYSELVSACDSAYTEFEKTGTATLATADDVSALEKQLADMKASRDHWWSQYQQVKSELDALQSSSEDMGV